MVNWSEGVSQISSGEDSILPVRALISLLDSFHDLTGFPWWITIASSALALRILMLPAVVLQMRKLKRIAELFPKLPPPLPPPLSGRSFIDQISLFRRERRAIGCPSFLWFLASFSIQVPCFLLFVTSIRRMSLDGHPGFDCGGTLWFQNLTETSNGVIGSGSIFPILIAALHYINVQLITKVESLELYEDMILGITFEDVCTPDVLQRQNVWLRPSLQRPRSYGYWFHQTLEATRLCCGTYRDHVHALSKGVPAREVMSELFGKTTGCVRGQGGSMHMFSKEHNLIGGFAFIGEGIPIATGTAFTSKYNREVLKQVDCDHVTLAFFGDGTCNNGQFFECLNMAALWKLPIVFVVENNLWAIGMSHERATSDPEIWKKGPAFGMPGVHVDGMDVLKVREVAKEAVERARRGDGPTLIECETYRFRGHSLADPDELRDPSEKARYAARDPITALKKYMIENKLAGEAELKAIEKKIDELIEEAVEFADASPHPDRSQLLQNVFADPKGFGIGPDGRYRCEDPKFTQGTAHV